MNQLRSTFKNRALRHLLAAQIPADFADWLDFVAVGALMAFTWKAEPVIFAFLAVCLGLPYLVVGPIAGVLVDRSHIKLVLIGSNLGRAVVTFAFAFAPNWQVLLALVLLRSSADAFFTPAKQAAIQAIVAPESRMAANGISHAINQASKIVAPALGGALLIGLTPQNVFLLNAIVSIVAASLLFALPHIKRPERGNARNGSVLANVKSGFAEIANNSRLRGALTLMAGGYFAMFFYDTLIAPLIRDLGFDGTGLGIALTAVGAGGVVGALWLGSKDISRPFLWVALGGAISGLTVVTIGFAEALSIDLPFYAFVALFAIVGGSSAMSVVPVRTVIQNETSPDRIARVTALNEAANTAALLTAPFLGALIASIFSIGVAFIAGGVLLIVIAGVALMLQRRGD